MAVGPLWNLRFLSCNPLKQYCMARFLTIQGAPPQRTKTCSQEGTLVLAKISEPSMVVLEANQATLMGG
jgi:hypothetical protein